MAYMDKMMGPPKDDEADEGELDSFGQAISEAFPDQDWTDEKLAALKEAIKICTQEDYADDDESSEDEPHGGKSTLALLFGKPKAGK